MIRRSTSSLVLERLVRFPAVALVGPRQSGKTTLARALGGRYFDLEQAGDRTRLDIEWDDVCSERGLTVLDEAQAWPEVFARLRGAIDAERKRSGHFLTSDGHEIDLLLDLGGERWAFEVKLTSQPDAHDVARLDRAADLVGATRRVLVSQTRRPAFSESRISSGLRPLLRHLLSGR